MDGTVGIGKQGPHRTLEYLKTADGGAACELNFLNCATLKRQTHVAQKQKAAGNTHRFHYKFRSILGARSDQRTDTRKQKHLYSLP